MVAWAQQKPADDKDADALQKAVQNPVADLISVPLQDNTNFGIGPFDRNQNVLNIQPVVPVHVSEKWNMIIRWITPVIWQPAPGSADLQALGIVENTPAYLLAQDAQKNAGVYGNAVYPTGGSPWSMRLQIAFLFPKLFKEEEKKLLEKKLKQLEEEQQQPQKK